MTFEEWWNNNAKEINRRYEDSTLHNFIWDTAYAAGVQAGRDEGMCTERERCVKVAEKTFKSVEARYGMTWYLYHKDIAAAIREVTG